MAATPAFLPGESHGQRSLEGDSPWGRTESDTAGATEHTHTQGLRSRRIKSISQQCACVLVFELTVSYPMHTARPDELCMETQF